MRSICQLAQVGKRVHLCNKCQSKKKTPFKQRLNVNMVG